MLAQRNENVAVQKCYLGLDFENAAMGCRLAEAIILRYRLMMNTTF
ncbi:hypothetical protein [Brasilonema bromeliae]|nr:hypothetical protein [Brasilonema bromeliae]